LVAEIDSASFIDRLIHSKCINYDELLHDLQFENYSYDTPYSPYDKNPNKSVGGYDTSIDLDKNCYIVFSDNARQSEDETILYLLKTLSPARATSLNSTGQVVLTHNRPCGVCSTLDQLAVYVSVPDLTSPVRKCGLEAVLSKTLGLKCLKNIGFRDACKYIWYYNTVSSRSLCGTVCLKKIRTPNNVPRYSRHDPNYCEPYSLDNSVGCKNTINGEKSCEAFQWQDGKFRLNSCLQCDECRSGPVFQKFSGRTRRNSGLESAIARPPSQIVHISQTSQHYQITVSSMFSLYR